MVRLAGIQISCSEEKERNVEKAIRFARIAVEKGANIICFQELFTTHWFPREMSKAHFSLAEKFDGPSIMRMRELAKESEVALVCPIFEADPLPPSSARGEEEGLPRTRYGGEVRFSEGERGGGFYNSAVVIDAGGETLGVYRKVHVPQIPLWEEKFYFAPGNLGFPVFKCKFATIGVQICWDNFFPEGPRILAMKGAQIIFSPTAAAFASQNRWETVIASNAIANGVYIFRVNRVGSEERQDFYGRSFCVSPEGELVDKPTGMKEGIAILDIDLRRIDLARKEWPFFRDRRPEVYKEIIA